MHNSVFECGSQCWVYCKNIIKANEMELIITQYTLDSDFFNLLLYCRKVEGTHVKQEL